MCSPKVAFRSPGQNPLEILSGAIALPRQSPWTGAAAARALTVTVRCRSADAVEELDSLLALGLRFAPGQELHGVTIRVRRAAAVKSPDYDCRAGVRRPLPGGRGIGI